MPRGCQLGQPLAQRVAERHAAQRCRRASARSSRSALNSPPLVGLAVALAAQRQLPSRCRPRARRRRCRSRSRSRRDAVASSRRCSRSRRALMRANAAARTCRGQTQRDIRAAPGRPSRHAARRARPVDPGAQRAVALGQLERQVDAWRRSSRTSARGSSACSVPLQRRQSPGAVEQRLAEARPQREAVAPGGRRRGVEAQVVLAQAVAHAPASTSASSSGGARALLVDPAHAAAADHELVLREEPVGRGAPVVAVAAPRQIEAADVQRPCASRRTSSCGAVDQQLLEARLQRQQRARRQRRSDARQPQRLAAVRRRAAPRRCSSSAGIQPRDVHLDRADAHRNAERARWPRARSAGAMRRCAAESPSAGSATRRAAGSTPQQQRRAHQPRARRRPMPTEPRPRCGGGGRGDRT